MTGTLPLPEVRPAWRPPAFRALAPSLTLEQKITLYDLRAWADRLGMEHTAAELSLLIQDASRA